MRAFIALELPAKIKTQLGEIQKELIGEGIKARWVKPKIAHLTLAFLGSIAPDKLETVEKILKEVAGQIKPAKLKLHQLGCFPSPVKAKIIFVDLQGELDKLNALAIKIRKRLKKGKIYFDQKPFVAHITLGRIKKKQNLTQITGKIKIKRLEFTARAITLNKSQLTETGPIYRTIKTVKLQSAN